MASSYDVINLSALAVPDAIVVPDAADIFTRWLARLRELDRNLTLWSNQTRRINRGNQRLPAHPGVSACQ